MLRRSNAAPCSVRDFSFTRSRAHTTRTSKVVRLNEKFDFMRFDSFPNIYMRIHYTYIIHVYIPIRYPNTRPTFVEVICVELRFTPFRIGT